MKALVRILGLAAMAGLAAACEPLDIDFGGGGGGGGGGAFSSGFVFVRNDKDGRNVYAVDEDGNASFPLRLTTQGGAYEPTVSRSGLLAAFVYRSGSTWEIRTVPTTGTGQASTVVSSTSTSCSGCSNFHYPTISPTGETIVFTLTKNNTSSLAKVNVDGSGFQIILSGTRVYGAASFFPDGRNVLVAAGFTANPLDTLLKVNLSTGVANPITSSLGTTGATSVVSRAVVSPDGSRVAFDGQTTNGPHIFVGQLDSQSLYNVTQLTKHSGDDAGAVDTWPSWRGNTEVTFLSNAGSDNNIYRISTATSGAGSLVVPIALEPSYGGT
ncbi:TolB family protein [Cystobacter ferrugineus]|uniref:Lipoprotein n=1 Tax=Cystobacter ferrugineus TaxID=83449 RepID=A0A1L9B366_9BACT|nr:PD40 domain-containing protein [Cystobacter ferrugineus]OJH36660.1 hypothetical protein BON30_33475 [Cystobacter ferrugineus]